MLRAWQRSDESVKDLPDTLRGRLGFDRATGRAPAWNERAGRFEQRDQHDGDVVPFVLRLSDLSVAFQRTSKIRRQSFIGALQKILREASQDDRWRVRDRVTELGWERFRNDIRTVREITVVVGPTNPGWEGQRYFQPFIDEVRGDRAKITMTGKQLDLDSEPVDQARVHALDNDYGELVVKGTNADGIDIRFDSDDPVPVLDTEAERMADGSVSAQALVSALEAADAIIARAESDSKTSLDDGETDGPTPGRSGRR